MAETIGKTGNILAIELQHLAKFLEVLGFPTDGITLEEIFQLRHDIFKSLDSIGLEQNLDNIKNPY